MFNYQKYYIVLQLTMAGECLGSMRLRLLLQRPLRLQHRPPWVRYALHAAAATRLRLRRTKQRRPLWVRRALHTVRRGCYPSEAPSRQATPVSAAVTAAESQLDKRSNTAKNKQACSKGQKSGGEGSTEWG